MYKPKRNRKPTRDTYVRKQFHYSAPELASVPFWSPGTHLAAPHLITSPLDSASWTYFPHQPHPPSFALPPFQVGPPSHLVWTAQKVLQWSVRLTHLEGTLKQISGSHLRVSDSVGLGRDPGIWVSNKSPGTADAEGRRTHFENHWPTTMLTPPASKLCPHRIILQASASDLSNLTSDHRAPTAKISMAPHCLDIQGAS